MSRELIEQRRGIQHLLDIHDPADALPAYYMLYHSEERTTLQLHRDERERVDGALALCQTGMDLFRPLLTLKAQTEDGAAALLDQAVPQEASVMIAAPAALREMVEAFYATSAEVTAEVLWLRPAAFRPVINVLVTRKPTSKGDPLFVIRGQSLDRGARPVGPSLATAGVNWRSPQFADIYVRTDPQARSRGLGQSVVSALSTWLIEQGVTPLYLTSKEHEASGRLAAGLGFKNTGVRLFLCDGVRR